MVSLRSIAVCWNLVSLQNPTAKESERGSIWQVFILVIDYRNVFINARWIEQLHEFRYSEFAVLRDFGKVTIPAK